MLCLYSQKLKPPHFHSIVLECNEIKLQTLQLPVSVQNEYNLLAEISMILTSLDCLSDRLKEELAMGCISIEKASFDESSYKISIS